MTEKNLKLIGMICLSAVLLIAGSRNTVAKDDKTSLLFQSHEPLTMSISAPFRDIHRYRDDERREYHDARLTMTDSNGREIQLDLEIRVRGHFRAKKQTCANPPLKLDFKRKQLDGTIFDGENKLKLAVQCRDSDSYAQYLLLEYLSYRVYQLFTDKALRVRLVSINYYDSERERDLGTSPAFFIEDEGRMAKRLGLEELDVERIKPGDYDPALINLVDVFEYFIGNTDWSSFQGPPGEHCCHNIIPLVQKDGPLIPVPYDFDITGVVNPRYAEVNSDLPIRSVRQRLYRGICPRDEVLRSTLAAFEDRRNEIRALYENQPGLSDRSIEYTMEFYDDFYDTIQDREKLQRNILDKCR